MEQAKISPEELKKRLEIDVLPRVRKPGRYSGGELNAEIPRLDAVRVALCFPEVYEIGMSNHGFLLLYHMINSIGSYSCERSFAPWIDMEEALRKENLPLYTLESFTPLSQFDVVGFSLSYEMTYSNVITMLDLGGIPLCSRDRNEEHPLVIAGGGCVVNPEPLAEFIDVFVVGEGEEVLKEILHLVNNGKKWRWKKAVLLKELSHIEGLYIPVMCETAKDERGRYYVSESHGMKLPVRRRYVDDLSKSFFPEKCVLPSVEAVHDRVNIELFRGCARGCRYCQAGMIYRPRRERSPELLAGAAKKMCENMGCEEVSLLSLNATDYRGMGPLLDSLLEFTTPARVSISMPSTRVDSFSQDVAEKLRRVRTTGLTIAPEAGTQRMRNVINKQITDSDIEKAVRASFSAGYKKVKLYFMIGLPGETMEDVAGIAELVRRLENIAREYKGRAKGKTDFTLSIANFVPKPHTPFQWEPMDSVQTLREKQNFLRDSLRGKNIKLDFHDLEKSRLEAVFSRGDRRLGLVLAAAWQKGVRMDGWSDMFDAQKWKEAFEETGINPEEYAEMGFREGGPLPWGHISIGVYENYLRMEKLRATREETTRDCVVGQCTGCGLDCRKYGK